MLRKRKLKIYILKTEADPKDYPPNMAPKEGVLDIKKYTNVHSKFFFEFDDEISMHLFFVQNE